LPNNDAGIMEYRPNTNRYRPKNESPPILNLPAAI
jgi:hypothetical protein